MRPARGWRRQVFARKSGGWGNVWRVTIPLDGAAGDGAPGELLAKVKRLGFADAYAVAL